MQMVRPPPASAAWSRVRGVAHHEGSHLCRVPCLLQVRSSFADCVDKSEAVNTHRGLVLVSSRELRDEELFLNYRLNPRNAYPKWYTPVDVEEDERRWTR